MSGLFSISFTTKKQIHVFDTKGKIKEVKELSTPITMHALPHSTAMSYSGADNFTITPYVEDERRGSRAGIGNGTKKFTYDKPAAETQGRQIASKSKPAQNATVAAAQSGNMGAAL